MPATRRRRIVRRAVMALSVVVLVAFVATCLVRLERPEIRRSRALRLGMNKTEVEAIMRPWSIASSKLPDGRELRGYGPDRHGLDPLLRRLSDWLGIDGKDTDDPVRVRFDANGQADRIERGEEIEEAP